MTRIRMLGGEGNHTGFEVSGHAGAGSKGRDLICAAISFLATTCANALISVAGVAVQATQEEGYLKAEVQGPGNEKAQTILSTFHQGAKDLQNAHPRHVKLI